MGQADVVSVALSCAEHARLRGAADRTGVAMAPWATEALAARVRQERAARAAGQPLERGGTSDQHAGGRRRRLRRLRVPVDPWLERAVTASATQVGVSVPVWVRRVLLAAARGGAVRPPGPTAGAVADHLRSQGFVVVVAGDQVQVCHDPGSDRFAWTIVVAAELSEAGYAVLARRGVLEVWDGDHPAARLVV